jgi:cytochrome P450
MSRTWPIRTPFFAEARAATPVFYSPDLEYWVVTRYHDMRQIFQTPQVFSAANTLAPLQPICPAAGHLLPEGGFRPVPTLTNSDPPRAHPGAAARQRRLHPATGHRHGAVYPGVHRASSWKA